MTSTATTPSVQCGCCGRQLPRDRVNELGNTPGVYICARCAVFALVRVSRVPVPPSPRQLWHQLRDHHGDHGNDEAFRMAIPSLPVTDLDRARAYYQQLGFAVVERLDHLAILQSGSIELHLRTHDGDQTPAHVFVHIGDPDSLWARLTAANVPQLSPVQTQPWGIRDFSATDPDGNVIRFGHPEG